MAVALALSFGGSSEGRSGTASGRPDAAKVAKSHALAAAPTIRPEVNRFRRDEAALREAIARVSARIPLPDGANFNGIRIPDLADMGGLGDDSLEPLLQANAACQWYVALARGREVPTARAIVRQIGNWSGVRNDTVWDAPTRELATRRAGAAFATMTATCEETGADQRRFALAHGLQPTI